MPETKDTTLTQAEQRRLERFNQTSERLISEGYTRENLTIDLNRAMKACLVFTIVLSLVAIALFFVINQDAGIILTVPEVIIFLVSAVALIAIHEGIHGLCWMAFTPNGRKDIEFGILREHMTPYCTCLAPLEKRSYIIGAAMPTIVLGIIPAIAAYPLASTLLLYIGVAMTVAGVGDAMIILKVMQHKQTKPEMLIYDHPTEGGCVVFQR